MKVRTFKVLLTAAVALAAFNAGSSAARAEPLFRSNQQPTLITAEEDGTGKTGHHVIDPGDNGSTTCSEASFSAVMSSFTDSSITLSGGFGKCTWAGLAAFFDMNGCTFTFYSTGTVDIGGVTCAADPIKFGVAGLCEFTIGPQSSLHEVTYHNLNPTTVTAETHLGGIHGEAAGPACPSAGTFTDGEYTTGNLLIWGGGANFSVS